jgi:hypothetical protein
VPRYILTVLLAGGLCVTAAGDDDPPTPPIIVKSAAAKKAEADYKTALAAAEQDFAAKVRLARAGLTKDLEKAKDAATKAGSLEDAVALRDRLKQLTDAAPPAPRKGPALARDKLGLEVADAVWSGSPNWGQFVLKSDGSVAYEKMADTTSRWGAVSDSVVCVADAGGNVSVLLFDKDRRAAKGFYLGMAGKASWEVTRVKSK